MVRVPASIDADALAHGVTLHLRSTRAGPALQFASTDEQRVREEPDGVELMIAPLDADAKPEREGKPVASDTEPNAWLQSDAPEIRKLAHDGAGDAVGLAATWFSGRPFPATQNKVLQLGWAVMRDALCAVGGVDETAFHQTYLKHSDPGVAQEFGSACIRVGSESDSRAGAHGN